MYIKKKNNKSINISIKDMNNNKQSPDDIKIKS